MDMRDIAELDGVPEDAQSLTAKEAASVLRVSARRVRQLAQCGKISVFRVGGTGHYRVRLPPLLDQIRGAR